MKQGEVWQIMLDPAIGAEIKKKRPALIVSTDALGKLPLKIIAPITDWKEQYSDYPWMVRINPTEQNGLVKVSAIDCFQIKSVSVERFVTQCGYVEAEIIEQVQDAIIRVIGVM
jgi:mRNA interferase MazF